MSKKQFKKHGIGKLWISFDTFRTPEGKDRFLKNIIRFIGILGFAVLWQYNGFLPFLIGIIFLIMAGMAEIRYFRLKRKRLEWEAWS
jgi:hypothetical protein